MKRGASNGFISRRQSIVYREYRPSYITRGTPHHRPEPASLPSLQRHPTAVPPTAARPHARRTLALPARPLHDRRLAALL